MRPLIAVMLLATLAACSGADAGEVPADVRQRVGVFVEDGNCRGLQAEFDHASSADVMEWIDEQMREAGCYG